MDTCHRSLCDTAPRSWQVVLIPIAMRGTDGKKQAGVCDSICDRLNAAGVRVHVDDRDNYNPGWK